MQDRPNIFSIFLAGVLHLLIFGGLIFGMDFSRSVPPAVPLAINASLVSDQEFASLPDIEEPLAEEPVVEPEPEIEEPEPELEPDLEEQERVRAAEEQRQTELREEAERSRIEEEKRLADQAAEQERVQALEQEREEEQERIRQQEEADRRRREQEEAERKQRQEAEVERRREEAERKRQEDLERQRQENEQKRREAEAAERQRQLDAELAEESNRLEAMNAGELSRYRFALQNKIQRNWIRPMTAQPGIECVVNVRQLPGGEVVDVQVESCNGDAAVVRSVEAAVHKASPLPMPENPSLFERNLRITFKPEQ